MGIKCTISNENEATKCFMKTYLSLPLLSCIRYYIIPHANIFLYAFRSCLFAELMEECECKDANTTPVVQDKEVLSAEFQNDM